MLLHILQHNGEIPQFVRMVLKISRWSHYQVSIVLSPVFYDEDGPETVILHIGGNNHLIIDKFDGIGFQFQ